MNLSKKEKCLSIAAAVIAAIVSIALFTVSSYWLDQKKQHVRLQEFSEAAYHRTQTVWAEFNANFIELAGLPASGCSEETIFLLRSKVKNSQYIKTAAVELGQNIYCSDSGLIYREKPKPDFITEDGAWIWINANTVRSTRKNTLFIQRGNIIQSSLNSHLVNVVADSGTQIVMISSKHMQVMAHYPESARIDPALLPKLAGRTASLSTARFLYSSKHDKDLSYTLIAFKAKQTLLAYWKESIWLWLPTVLIIGLLVGYASFKQLESRHALPQKLAKAIKSGALTVYYQPIISLLTGKCIGAETLIRWKDSDGEMIPPEHFIPMAEENGLIEPLTDLIMNSVIKELGAHLKNKDFYISINLSARDMAKPRFYELLKSRLAEHGIAPSKIVIEATERGFCDVVQANSVIKKFHDSGHTVFIDDFGTGYSSLSYLQNLSIDCIKIDKSFVDAIDTKSATSSVILHIIAMAKQLNLKTVAEGVETQSQADFLRQHGVDAVQGYYFAQPMPAAGFLSFIEANHGLAGS